MVHAFIYSRVSFVVEGACGLRLQPYHLSGRTVIEFSYVGGPKEFPRITSLPAHIRLLLNHGSVENRDGGLLCCCWHLTWCLKPLPRGSSCHDGPEQEGLWRKWSPAGHKCPLVVPTRRRPWWPPGGVVLTRPGYVAEWRTALHAAHVACLCGSTPAANPRVRRAAALWK